MYYLFAGPNSEMTAMTEASMPQFATVVSQVLSSYFGFDVPTAAIQTHLVESTPGSRRLLADATRVASATVGLIPGETPANVQQALTEPSSVAMVAQNVVSAGLIGALGGVQVSLCNPSPYGCKPYAGAQAFSTPALLTGCDIDLCIMLDNSGSITDPTYGGSSDSFKVELQLAAHIMTTVAARKPDCCLCF